MRYSFVLPALLSVAIASPVFQPQKPLGDEPCIIDSDSLQDDMNADALFSRAEDLFKIAKKSLKQYNRPTRVIGSKGHEGTLDYIYEEISKLGDYYTLSNQSFPAVVGDIFESRLVLGADVPSTAHAMDLTPPTKNKQPVTGPLVLVSNNGCNAADYPKVAKGAIVLIKRGVCPFGDKSSGAGKAGAVAAVIYNNEKGDFGGTLGAPDPNHIATFGMSSEQAAPVIEQLGKGKFIDGSAYIDSIVQEILTTNIVAQTTGGDQDNCVMLGGHSDSVGAGPGINDDGTGTITLIEVATQLAKYEVNNCVRFAWWAGEEEGLLGSDYYVSQLTPAENVKIRMFMDYDMMASPNFAYEVYNATNAVNPVGSEQLRDLYTQWYEDRNLNWTYIDFDGRSDYDAFIKNGIPGGGIATGAEGVKTAEEVEMFGGVAGQWYDHCYHQLCDDTTNLNMTAWETNAKLIAHSVATYAKSLEGFPERVKKADVDSISPKATGYKPLYHGHHLIM